MSRNPQPLTFEEFKRWIVQTFPWISYNEHLSKIVDEVQLMVQASEDKVLCRFCIEMRAYGDEGSMKCDRDLSTGDEDAKNCRFYRFFLDYQYCEDCKTVFDFWKYDYDLEAAGHKNHKIRPLTQQEYRQALKACEAAGCFK